MTAALQSNGIAQHEDDHDDARPRLFSGSAASVEDVPREHSQESVGSRGGEWRRPERNSAHSHKSDRTSTYSQDSQNGMKRSNSFRYRARRKEMQEEWMREDEMAGLDARSRELQVPWIHKPGAQTFFGAVICINAICLAVETDMHTGSPEESRVLGTSQDEFWLVVESIFLVVFITELTLRLCADGCMTFRDPWNCLDLLLVAFGVFDAWILQVLLAGTVQFFNASFLRIMRLLRLARIAKVFRFFHVLAVLIEGVLNAMRMIVWFVLLLVVLLFTCAIFCTTAFGKSSEHPIVAFETVPSSMMTLFQLVTLESWPSIYKDSSEGHPVIWIFFVMFIFTANMVLLNMMTGVIVEHVLSIARAEEQERERIEQKKRAQAMTNLKRVFQLLDRDESGKLSHGELELLHHDTEALERLQDLNIAVDQMVTMFDRMDIKQTGELSIDEFIDGCLRYCQGGTVERDLLHVHLDLRAYLDSEIRDHVTTLKADIETREQGEFAHLESQLLRLHDNTRELMMSLVGSSVCLDPPPRLEPLPHRSRERKAKKSSPSLIRASSSSISSAETTTTPLELSAVAPLALAPEAAEGTGVDATTATACARTPEAAVEAAAVAEGSSAATIGKGHIGEPVLLPSASDQVEATRTASPELNSAPKEGASRENFTLQAPRAAAG